MTKSTTIGYKLNERQAEDLIKSLCYQSVIIIPRNDHGHDDKDGGRYQPDLVDLNYRTLMNTGKRMGRPLVSKGIQKGKAVKDGKWIARAFYLAPPTI